MDSRALAEHYQHKSGGKLFIKGDDFFSPTKPAGYVALRLIKTKEFYQRRIPLYSAVRARPRSPLSPSPAQEAPKRRLPTPAAAPRVLSLLPGAYPDCRPLCVYATGAHIPHGRHVRMRRRQRHPRTLQRQRARAHRLGLLGGGHRVD
eukprot:4890637-Prymnesium_polylepis.2